MKVEVLGCAGGIGGDERLTTCLSLDGDVLLDGGTGLSRLDIKQLAKIDHVFLTHSHLDHVAGLALLLDTVLGKKTGPVTVHATEKVIETLKTHMFNWSVWPDFATIPNVKEAILHWEPMEYGATVDLGGRLITSYPVNHTVDAVAFWVRDQQNGFLFSGDMSSSPDLWRTLKNEKKINKVFVDCSFPNDELEIATKSKHFCPQSLLADIRDFPLATEFMVYHLKPGQETLIMEELHSAKDGHTFRAVKCGDVFIF